MWLENYHWVDHEFLTPDFSHLLISRDFSYKFSVILDVASLEQVAADYSISISKYEEYKYTETSIEGIPTSAKWDSPIHVNQKGDIIEIINQDS